MSEHVHTDVLFEIVGNHPHKGEKAHPVGHTPHSMTQTTLFNGSPMYLLELIDCSHGTDRCYASKENMRLIKK
jgi:hypothetical protein